MKCALKRPLGDIQPHAVLQYVPVRRRRRHYSVVSDLFNHRRRRWGVRGHVPP